MSDRLKCFEKKILSYTTAATLVIGLLGLTACDYQDDDITATQQAEYDQQLTQESLPRGLAEDSYKVFIYDSHAELKYRASAVMVDKMPIANGQYMPLLLTANHVIKDIKQFPDGTLVLARPQYGELDHSDPISISKILVSQSPLLDIGLMAVTSQKNTENSIFMKLLDKNHIPSRGPFVTLDFGISSTTYNIHHFKQFTNTDFIANKYPDCPPLTTVIWESTDLAVSGGASGAPVVNENNYLAGLLVCSDDETKSVVSPITNLTLSQLKALLNPIYP